MGLKNENVNVNLTLKPTFGLQNLGEIKSYDYAVDTFTFIIKDKCGRFVFKDGDTVAFILHYIYENEPYMIHVNEKIRGGLVVLNVDTLQFHKGFEGRVRLNVLCQSDNLRIDCGEYEFYRKLSLSDVVAHEVDVSNDTFINYDDMLQKAVDNIKQDILNGDFDINLPHATSEMYGVVKVGDSLVVDDGVLNTKPIHEYIEFKVDENGHLIMYSK